ncbi:MAG TPA: NAD(P)-dependent oxidoreductase [Thermoanaerobaculia bacterium]|nr:NAD(P)-dependent oxidoreductase [Thermoanaerobaculia bacterium]
MPEEQEQRAAVAITGGAGLIGSRAVEALVSDHRVFVLDAADWPQGEPPPGCELIHVDLTDDGSVAAALEELRERCGGRLASLIHLAAYYDFSGSDSPLYSDLTVEGTRRLLRGLRRDFDVGQFVFSSTLLVMEPVDEEDERLTEESPTEAEWPYPESKLEAEAVLRAERGDIPVVVLRIAGAYDEDGHSPPLGQHIKRIHDKQLESYLFPGDADHGQPYVHLDDVVSCLVKTVERRAALGDFEVFLVAEPDLMSHDELQDTLGELIHGREWPTILVPKTVARTGAWLKEHVLGQEMFIKPWMVALADDHYPVEIGKARRLLEWEPRHRLRETLPEMVRRMKEDPRGWFERNGLVETEEDTEEDIEEAMEAEEERENEEASSPAASGSRS